MSRTTLLRRAALLCALATCTLSAAAEAQRIVTPGDGTWSADDRGTSGTAAITGTNPRNGNGSLELGVTGDPSDWGWFTLFAGDPLVSSFGQLGALTQLSFDWYRESSADVGDIVWDMQSVAFRLFVRSGPAETPTFSELVWESYYNGAGAPRDQWLSQDLSNQVFWRFVTGEGYTIDDCSSPGGITPGIPLKTATAAAWGSGGNCYGEGAVVYGLGIGVGSNWPHEFRGYADDVKLGFGSDPLVVNDNFELGSQTGVVPEPATLILVGTGLAGVGGALRRRRAAGRG